MPALQRNSAVFHMPRFYDEGEKLMWVYDLDGSTRMGPREATDDDLVKYPEAFARYQENWQPSINPNMEQLTDPEEIPPTVEGQYAKRRRQAEA